MRRKRLTELSATPRGLTQPHFVHLAQKRRRNKVVMFSLKEFAKFALPSTHYAKVKP